MNTLHYVQYISIIVTALLLWLAPLSSFAEKDPYKIISEKNLFRPDRSEWVIEKAKETKDKHVDPDKLELFGTIIVGDEKSALIYKEKARIKGRRSKLSRMSRSRKGKEAELYSPGDYIGGYILSKIEEKRVVLDYFGETVTLNLHDGKEPTKGDVTPLDVKKTKPKSKPRKKPKSKSKKQRIITQRQLKAMEKKFAAGKIPKALAPFISQEKMKKLVEFNKEIMAELKESGGELDPAAIQERVEEFKEKFIQAM